MQRQQIQERKMRQQEFQRQQQMQMQQAIIQKTREQAAQQKAAVQKARIQAARKKAIFQKARVQAARQKAAVQKARVQAARAQRQAVIQNAGVRVSRQRNIRVNVKQTEMVQDIVSLDEVLVSLETSSRAWPLIIDNEAKQEVVNYFIKKYRRERVVISKTSEHYVRLIDGMSQTSPEMLAQPFEQVFKIVATLEYDFDNGQDRDTQALKVLGSRGAVLQNKARIGIE